MCQGLGLADLAGTLHQWPAPSVAADRLAGVFLTRRAEDWAASLGPLGASGVRVNRGPELRNDPQVTARNVLQEVGGMTVPRSPVRIKDAATGERPPAATFAPPPVGTRTRAALEKTGLSGADIDELLESGAIGEPRPA